MDKLGVCGRSGGRMGWMFGVDVLIELVSFDRYKLPQVRIYFS